MFASISDLSANIRGLIRFHCRRPCKRFNGRVARLTSFRLLARPMIQCAAVLANIASFCHFPISVRMISNAPALSTTHYKLVFEVYYLFITCHLNQSGVISRALGPSGNLNQNRHLDICTIHMTEAHSLRISGGEKPRNQTFTPTSAFTSDPLSQSR